MAASETRERERRSGSADQAADVTPDGDVPAPREGEHEIGDDHAEGASSEDVVALLLQHETRTEDPEDRA